MKPSTSDDESTWEPLNAKSTSEIAKPPSSDPYLRIVMLFDRDETAGSFLREDGEGGFTGAVYRMAREIDRLRDALKTAEEGDTNG